MKLAIFLLFFCLFPTSILFAQRYNYKVNLKEISKDQLTIKLKVPNLKQKTLLFQFPVVIPGSYGTVDFGRFILKLEAKDKNGNKLKVSHPTLNTWKIKNAENIDEISYRVNDTWDTNIVTNPAGTNIDSNVFLFNNHGFFGFFKNYEHLPFNIEIDRPSYLYGGTALKKTGGDHDTDIFEADSYFKLIDNPILFARPDTATFKVGNTTFLVQLYSPTGRNNSKSFVKDLKQIVIAQQAYLNKQLPLEQYVFLIFMIKEFENYRASWGIGALEHTNSSVYCLKEGALENLRYVIRDIAAHEFFHTWTPLSIRSKEIHFFDFMEPKMSKHLWLYEGGTEYASIHYQVQNGVMTVQRYLDILSSKIKNSGRYDNSIPFTVMSKKCVNELSSEYGNVYQKGALINLCLDLKLRILSNGTYGFQNMIHDLSQKYHAKKPFNDEDLFDEISELSGYPNEIRDFFKSYVEGPEPLPIGQLMDEVGISFLKNAVIKELSAFGFNPNNGLRFNNEQAKLELQEKGIDSFGKNIMGFLHGDLLYKWQGKELEMRTLKETWEVYKKSAKDGDLLNVTVLRKNKDGVYVEVELSAKLIQVETEINNTFVINPKATAKVLKIRNAWLGNYRTK
ncbi:M61 family metallopeptidase [Aureispira anguillae]|uniref:Peptidase M61 n=1 Tax=Aureispira anguillae TaxID=2864201 RepID=A0A915YCZ3_9BACT|nr:peptidase M61 [Aureispira anguillae]BDS10783.1 peptidase M61 [Aureispira anguillae]